MEFLVSSFQLTWFLAVASIWDVNQQMKCLPICLSKINDKEMKTCKVKHFFLKAIDSVMIYIVLITKIKVPSFRREKCWSAFYYCNEIPKKTKHGVKDFLSQQVRSSCSH